MLHYFTKTISVDIHEIRYAADIDTMFMQSGLRGGIRIRVLTPEPAEEDVRVAVVTAVLDAAAVELPQAVSPHALPSSITAIGYAYDGLRY